MLAATPAAFESTGPGGDLRWRERRDGHWHAEAPGGYFDAIPMRRGYHLWFRPTRIASQSYVDLGHHESLGGVFSAARYYLDEQQTSAAEDRPALRWADVSFDLASDAEKFAHAIEKRGRGVTAERFNLVVTTNATWNDIQHVLEHGTWEKGYRVTSAAKKFDKAAEGCGCAEDDCAHRHPPSVPTTACEEEARTAEEAGARRRKAVGSIRWYYSGESHGWYGNSSENGKDVRGYFLKKDGKKWVLRFRGNVGPVADTFDSEKEAFAGAAKLDKTDPPDAHRSFEAKESIANAPSPMHVEIPPDAYKEWVEFGDRIGPVDTTEKIYNVVSPETHKYDQEIFLVVVTDLHFKLRSVTEVARGERAQVGVGIEEVMRAALMTPGASHVYVVHGHPTGKCRPSPADRKLHADIEKAASTYASLQYLDHVVIGVGEYYSIREGKHYKVK